MKYNKDRWLPLWAILFFVFMILAIFGASIAKADGFNPAEVYPGEAVFDYSLLVATGTVHWEIAVLDTQPQGADFWGICTGPFNPLTGDAYPYCSTDDPIDAFEPAGSSFDIATVIFGFDPGLDPPGMQLQALSVTTPEPSTILLVGAAFLLFIVLAWKRFMDTVQPDE